MNHLIYYHFIYHHLVHLIMVYHYHLPIIALREKPKGQRREPFYKGCGVVYLPGDINGFKVIAFIRCRVLCR